uniref:Uncharacterized protein n=1 Tax=Anguilla anguilla TaxID=7936 RepID=A0A0E9UUG1_ANGAN
MKLRSPNINTGTSKSLDDDFVSF